MNRVWQALILGGVFVGIVGVLGLYHMATPLPFWLLLPGAIAAVCVPGSGFDLKTSHPLSPVFYLVLYAVNVALYGGLAYLMLRFGSEDLPNASKQPRCLEFAAAACYTLWMRWRKYPPADV